MITTVLTLCLGEALVDLVHPTPLRPGADGAGGDFGDEPAFVASPGGVMANVALTAASCGAAVALVGGAGDDRWGHWLHDRLERGGVDLSLFGVVERHRTPVAFVTVDDNGEPSYALHGDGIGPLLETAGPRLLDAIAGAGALCLGSNTMVGEPERELTMAARTRALELGKPVVLDANLRSGRWPETGRAASVVRECVPGCLLVKANQEEARLLTGERGPAAAAAALLAAGARNALVTLGPGGALLRGEIDAEQSAPAAKVVNAAGGGDVVLGVVLARLGRAGFYAPAIAASLGEAVERAAQAVESWSAVPGA